LKGNNIQRVLIGLMALAVIMIIGGYIWQTDLIQKPGDLAVAFYKTIQSFVLEIDIGDARQSWLILAGIFLAPISLAGAVIIGLFEAVREAMTVTYLRLFFRGHVIIAGPEIQIQHLLAGWTPMKGTRFVILGTGNPDSTEEWKRCRRTLTVRGDLTTPRSWRHAGIRHCRAVILLNDNIESMATRRNSLTAAAGNRGTPRLFIGLENPDELDALGDIYGIQNHREQDGPVRGFSMKRLTAVFLAQEYPPHHRVGIENLSRSGPHIVFDGFTPFAGHLIVEFAQLYVYPSLTKLRISIVVDDDEGFRSFLSSCPGLNQAVDFQLHSRESFSREIRLEDPASLISRPQAVYLFSPSLRRIPALARNWRRFLAIRYDDTGMTTDLISIITEEVTDPEVAVVLKQKLKNLHLAVIHPGVILNPEKLLDDETLIDTMARKIHTRYRRKYTMPSWEELSYREMEVNRRSARHYLIKLAYLGYRISDKDSSDTVSSSEIPELEDSQIQELARMEHRRWMVEKYLNDFLSPVSENLKMDSVTVKNTLRIHGDLKEFALLTEEDIAKDIATFEDWKAIITEVLGVRHLEKLNPIKEREKE